MKRLYVLSLAIAILIIGPILVSAQQGKRVVYQMVGFTNVDSDKTAAYIDFQRNTVSKVIQQRMKTDQILSWAVYQVTFRGLPASEGNFATVTVFSGTPTHEGPEVVQQATGMTPNEFGAKARLLSTSVGNILLREDAHSGSVPLQQGNIVTTYTWKITPQRGAEYGRYIQTTEQFNSQRAKDGQILSWVASRVVSPGGGESPFDAVTATAYKDMDSALHATAPDTPNQEQIQFIKVFPNQNFSTFVDQGRVLRRAVRSQMLRVVASVQRPTTTSSR